ncbi:transposase [Secundilactobacillus pentosiphilus]|uniref:Transposase n=1 Tax=Secundilactobacillus pentosiphilus TaxID=1714682 RepID=A0A1Z5IQ90_9LACO|nr:ornithine cyclodeaminase family protein [Secundilactobacillus pentosiphilus]GAX03923.1 transposase [Secundilactobacillus pentosiphilus]
MRVLTAADLQQVLDFPSVIKVVEDAYREKATGEGTIWPMIYHEFISDQADMDIRSGYLKSQGVYGMKLLSWFAGNDAKQLPELNGTVNLYDDQTGLPKGIVNAAALTGYRTGAAGAVAAKILANPKAANLLLVGSGSQAIFQVMAELTVLPKLKTVTIVNVTSPAHATDLAQTLVDQLTTQFLPAINQSSDDYQRLAAQLNQLEVSASDNLEAATQQAGVIVTATPSTKAMINADWVKPGTHINTMGADMAGKQEVNEQLFRSANVYVDDRTQAAKVGEAQTAVKAGITTADQLPEIGELLAKTNDNQWDAKSVTLFDSTGIALQDIASANLALENAAKLNLGQTITL